LRLSKGVIMKRFITKLALVVLAAVVLGLMLVGDAEARGSRGTPSRSAPSASRRPSTPSVRPVPTRRPVASPKAPSRQYTIEPVRPGRPRVTKGYHQRHGKQFHGGYYFPGRGHYHWRHRCWSRFHNCWTYWCGSSRCYYYWCAPRSCFYPISYRPFGTS